VKRILLLTLAFVNVGCWMHNSPVLAAQVSAGSAKAKQEAEAKGFIFATSKDEIVAKAKEEGKLEVLTFLENDAKKAMIESFQKKYPFVRVSSENIGGTDEYQRFILEMKAGRAKRWDTVHISNQVYWEYPPYLKKFDILGMAEHGLLSIPPRVIDPSHRTIVSKSTQVSVAAYNKKLLPADKVPATWEGVLKPEFKGRKFIANVRPLSIANLVPAWGLEKALDFARKFAEQKPVWNRGSGRALTSMAAGEHALFVGINLGSVLEAQPKDPGKNLELQLVDPVPVRFGSADGILGTSTHPYAGLLWLEFQCSPEGQAILDKYGPGDGSMFISGSMQHDLLRGRQVSLLGWDLHQNLEQWVEKLVEAYGFPMAEKGR